MVGRVQREVQAGGVVEWVLHLNQRTLVQIPVLESKARGTLKQNLLSFSHVWVANNFL